MRFFLWPLAAASLFFVFELAGLPGDDAQSATPASPLERRAFGGIQPRLSPDSKSIALSFQGAICRMDREGGVLIRLSRDEGWDIEPSWSPDSRWIAYINAPNFSTGRLRVIQAEDG